MHVPESMPLNDVLAALGYTTAPLQFQGKSIIRNGVTVFAGTAGEVWAWLRETRQIEQAGSSSPPAKPPT